MVPDLIFDLGMHDGSDTAYYLAKGFRVVAVEANPQLCRAAERRFASEIAAGRLTILNIGVGPERGDFDFYVSQKLDWSSFVKAYAERAGPVEVVRIPCIPLDDLLRERGIPYYLKIDIEGHDRSSLAALAKLDEFPRYVSVEATVGYFHKTMAPLGYTGFKAVNQLHHQQVVPIYPPIEGRFTDMKITGVMSGAFGDESYGPWLTFDEFDVEFRRVVEKRYDGSGQQAAGVPEDRFVDGWYDLHAKLG